MPEAHTPDGAGPNGVAPGLSFEALWEKPLVPAEGGGAFLLLRIAPGPKPPAGARRAPLDVAFALDRSDSMGGDKLALVKEAVDVAVQVLRDQDRVALTVYDHTAATPQPLAAATARTKTALRLALHGIDAGGSTALADGWLTACRELADAQSAPGPGAVAPEAAGVRVRRALLLTDGLANVGETDPAALTEHAHQLRRRGIGTTTLGVGLDFDEGLLSALAEAGGGNFEWIGEAGALRAFFEREIGELLTLAASDLTITLTLPDGVRATVVSAYPSECHDQRLVVHLGALPAGEDIPLLIAFDVEPGAGGAVRQLALEATWADPVADIRRRATPAVPPLVHADAATVEATPADPRVQEQAALQRSAAAQREAVRFDRAGRYAERRRLVRESSALLAAAPATDAIVAARLGNDVLAMAGAEAPLAEEHRKRTTWFAHQAARGRRRRDE